jgi:hypothetical protein
VYASFDEWQRVLFGEPAGKANAKQSLKNMLHRLVQRSYYPIQFWFSERREWQFATKENRVLNANGKMRANQLFVASKQ